MDCFEPTGGSGVEEYRPKGSGERGIIGESEGFDDFLLIEGVRAGYPCSSSSSRFLLSVSADMSDLDDLGLGIYDFGADVVTPLTASRGGDGGPSDRRGGDVRAGSFSDEKGTAGQVGCFLDSDES